jgi:hypothetical protein
LPWDAGRGIIDGMKRDPGHGIVKREHVEGVSDKAPPPPSYAFINDEDTPDVRLRRGGAGRLFALIFRITAIVCISFFVGVLRGVEDDVPGTGAGSLAYLALAMVILCLLYLWASQVAVRLSQRWR